MLIRVKSIHGRDEQFEVSPEDTIQHLQELCTAKFDSDASRMRLIFRGRHLGDLNATLSSAGITDGLVVHLVERPPNIEPIPVDPAEQNRPRRGRTSTFFRDILSRFSGGGAADGGGAPEGLLNMMGMPSVDDPRDSVVQRAVTLRGSRLTQVTDNASELERIAQLAISGMDFIPEETRRSIEARWQENALRITIPPFRDPHVAAPSMERVHTVDGIFHYLRHYRSILLEDNSFFLLIDSILNGARPDNSYLVEQARILADSLENVPRVPLRRGAGEVDDGSPDMAGRFQGFGNGEGVMRHVLDRDLVGLLEELWEHHRWLEPFILRYRQLLSSRMVFDINDRQNLANDGRANLVCVFFEHMQQTLHRLAHATHVLSDLNIHLIDPLPRRLYPQFAHFHVAPSSRGELTLQVVSNGSASNSVPTNAGNVLHVPAPGTDPLLHPDGRPTLMTLFPTGIGVVHQVAAMMVEASITVDSDGEIMDDESIGSLHEATESSNIAAERPAESSSSRPLTVNNRTENIQNRLAQFSSIRNMDTTILRRLAVDIHGLLNRANSNSDHGNIYEDLFRSLIAAVGLSNGSTDVSTYLQNGSGASPANLLQSILRFLNDGIVNRVASSDLTSPQNANNLSPTSIGMNANQVAANLFGQRLGNISFPTSSIGSVAPDMDLNRREAINRLAPNASTASAALRPVRSAPNLPLDERLAGFGIPLPSTSGGNRRMPTMEDFQGMAGVPYSSQGRHEQFIPLDPFLLCNSRFSRLRHGGRNLSHYEQVTQGHLTRRPIRPPPPEYLGLQVNSTNDGVLLFGDHDEDSLVQFIQLSIRSLIAQMHERDGNRTARGSPPVNNVLQQIQSLQESSMPSEQMMIGLGPSIGISLNSDELPPELARMLPPALRSRLPPSANRPNVAVSRSHAGDDSRAAQRAANIMSSIPNISTGNTRTEAQSAPSAKKRKVNEPVVLGNVPSTSPSDILRRNVFPSIWRGVIDQDVNATAFIAPLSDGYTLGLPTHLRNVAGGVILPRNSSVGGVVSNLYQLTVDPQDDDLS